MKIYCPKCGRAIPSDSKMCAYCGKLIPYHETQMVPEEPKKSDDKKTILIVVLVLIIMIIPTIAIAATVYVYVSSMTPDLPNASYEGAVVNVDSSERHIQVTLISGGNNYNNGYEDFSIMVDNQFVNGSNIIGYWTIGEKINIGEGAAGGYEVYGKNLSAGTYGVTVVIKDTVIYDGAVKITEE